MALIKADRVKETSTSTTTSNFILGGAATGYRTFSSVCAVGDTFYYAISNQSNGEWEVGLGTYGVPNILERTTVHASSNSGAKVNFSAGTKECFLTLTARHLDRIQDNGQSTAIGSKTSVVAVNDSATLPDLDLQFADLKTLTAKYGPTPSYSRASTGTYFNASGVLTSAAVNEPRFDHVLENGVWVSKGLLIEEQRTNLVQRSEDFGNAYYFKSDCSISANQIAAPDGATTADKLVENTANAIHYFSSSGYMTTNQTYACSIFAKAAERNWIKIYIWNGSTSLGAWFNLSSGTIGTNESGITSSIQNVGNGWYRCSITRTVSSGLLENGFGVILATADNSVTYIGNGSSGVYIWGSQVEAGSFSTSYIGTTSSSVTRSSDVCQITGSAFTNLWNATEGSVVVEQDLLSYSNPAADQRYFSIAGAFNQPAFILNYDNGTDLFWYRYFSGLDQLVLPDVNSAFKVALAFKTNDYATVLNGGTLVTSSTKTLPTDFGKMDIGYQVGDTARSSWVQRIRYFRSRLDNTQLVNLSGGINTLAFKSVTGSGSVTVANEYTGINISVPNPLPITNGGTGAQTQLNAVTNLVGNPPNDGGQYTLASKKTSGTPTFYWVDGTGYAPTLDLLFAADKSLTAYKGPTPSFSRASSGSYFDSVGVLRYSNVNLITYSEQFDNAAWTDRVGSTLTTNVVASPNGDLTADQIQLTSSGFYYQKKAYTTTGSHTFSIWIRSISPTTVTLRLSNDAGTESATVNCNVTTSWQRFSVTRNWTSNPVNFYAGIDQRTVVGGVGTEANIYVWGAQLEVGSSATQYTKTEASTNAAPRFNHTFNGTSWVSRGLLVEEQRTNVITYSEDLQNFVAAGSVTANSTIAPDGTLTADTLSMGVGSGEYGLRAFPGTITNNLTMSIYAKKGTHRYLQLRTNGGGGYANFDLETGTTINYGASLGSSMINVGNGWYRCICVLSASSPTAYRVSMISSMASGFPEFIVGTGAENFIVWGWQIEEGSFATSYIKSNSGSQTTRSADVCQITGADFSNTWNPLEGSAVVEFDIFSSTSYSYIFNAFDANTRIPIGFGNDSSGFEMYTWNTAYQARFLYGSLTANTNHKAAYGYKENDFAGSLNGSVASTDTSGVIPVGSRFTIGNYNGTNFINGHITRIRYYPVRLPNATIQVLST